MKRDFEWQEFISNLILDWRSDYQQTKEHEYVTKHMDYLNDIIDSVTIDDYKEAIDDCIFDISLAHDREAELLYAQGLRDCVYILKQLGVLS